jgi:hypothetical protein
VHTLKNQRAHYRGKANQQKQRVCDLTDELEICRSTLSSSQSTSPPSWLLAVHQELLSPSHGRRRSRSHKGRLRSTLGQHDAALTPGEREAEGRDPASDEDDESDTGAETDEEDPLGLWTGESADAQSLKNEVFASARKRAELIAKKVDERKVCALLWCTVCVCVCVYGAGSVGVYL